MLVCCANSLGVRRGGGGVGANEDEFLGMRKLSLALPASSKKKKKNWLTTINNAKLPDFISVRTRKLAVTKITIRAIRNVFRFFLTDRLKVRLLFANSFAYDSFRQV